MLRQIGPPELILIFGVVVLLFGAKRLPDLARGSGRALRIFKSEIQELHGDDSDGVAEATLPLDKPESDKIVTSE